MTTKETVENFYKAKSKKAGWQSMFTDEVKFKGSGMPSMKGKQALIEITEDLLTRLEFSEIKKILIEGNTAVVLNHYHLISPRGDKMLLETAEIVEVKENKIDSFDVYFDTTALNNFMAKF